MCGITGVYAFNNSALSFKNKIEKALVKLYKRGPESSGTFFCNQVGLGHTRLAIIDLSESGVQPFTDLSERFTIVFNGEFFNYKEHRNDLLKKGIRFKSESDTEVLLNLYLTEGPPCLQKVNGFFSIAIYDKQEETLFIARDRMGVKPLFIYQDNDKFIFASELKALLQYDINKEIDRTSLAQYLQLNYIPSPYSIFTNVRKLKQGNYILISKGSIQEKEYYTIPFYPQKQISISDISYSEAQNKLKKLLDESVKKRMVSDVLLGSFLSGGVDSSIIVALASKYTDKLKTFSIGYKDEPLFDETKYAKLVAKKFNTEHTEFILSNDDLFSILFEVLDYTDEPFADSSALAVYMLSKQTRKNVTVALSGDGADELFGGYNKHNAEYRARNAGIIENIIASLNPIWKRFPQSRNTSFSNFIRQLDRFSEGMKLSAKDRYWQWCSFVTEKEIAPLFTFPKDIYSERKQNIVKHINPTRGMNDVLLTDMQLVLVNDMLVKVDMMSMANSLEVRTPFLDYELVNFAFSLPSEYKMDKNTGKKILQDCFQDVLPPEIYHRKKHGFEVPLLKWFRKELNTLIFNELLEDNFIKQQDLFEITEIRKLKNKLMSPNPGDAASRIWGLVVFQYWWKKYMVNN